MALNKKTPETIQANLKVKAQGVENTLLLTYHNRSPGEYDKFVKNPENLKTDEADDLAGMTQINVALTLFLVKSFDDGTEKDFPLTHDGLTELERMWPGTLFGIVKGFHQSRMAAVEKN